MEVRNEVIFGNVNDDIRTYFNEFGTVVGHELMCKTRMRVIFNQALTYKNLTAENKAAIMSWHKNNQP